MAALQTPTTGPEKAVPQAEGEAAAVIRFDKRLILIPVIVLALFAGTYLLAWWNAARLTSRFLEDANERYEQREYLEALVGGQEFDPQTNRYSKVGGYVDVEKIWSNRYSAPVPPAVEQARERTDEIIYQHLTIPQAERYIQANIGRPAPYFGEIYLRLGELYEQEGDMTSAREIYEDIPSLFPSRPDLIELSQEHLQRLGDS
jgi:tetratricopeptide (TPR) repeat protein